MLPITNIIPPLYPNSTSFIHTLGVSHISRQNSLFCPKSTPWNIIIFSRGQMSSQGTTTLEMHKFFHRPYFSYPRKWSKIFLHRVTTHKIQISTNDANFIDSQSITISYISITCLNSTPQYKRIVPTTTIFLFRHNYLAQASFSFGQSLGKCPTSLQ